MQSLVLAAPVLSSAASSNGAIVKQLVIALICTAIAFWIFLRVRRMFSGGKPSRRDYRAAERQQRGRGRGRRQPMEPQYGDPRQMGQEYMDPDFADPRQMPYQSQYPRRETQERQRPQPDNRDTRGSQTQARSSGRYQPQAVVQHLEALMEEICEVYPDFFRGFEVVPQPGGALGIILTLGSEMLHDYTAKHTRELIYEVVNGVGILTLQDDSAMISSSQPFDIPEPDPKSGIVPDDIFEARVSQIKLMMAGYDFSRRSKTMPQSSRGRSRAAQAPAIVANDVRIKPGRQPEQDFYRRQAHNDERAYRDQEPDYHEEEYQSGSQQSHSRSGQYRSGPAR